MMFLLWSVTYAILISIADGSKKNVDSRGLSWREIANIPDFDPFALVDFSFKPYSVSNNVFSNDIHLISNSVNHTPPTPNNTVISTNNNVSRNFENIRNTPPPVKDHNPKTITLKTLSPRENLINTLSERMFYIRATENEYNKMKNDWKQLLGDTSENRHKGLWIKLSNDETNFVKVTLPFLHCRKIFPESTNNGLCKIALEKGKVEKHLKKYFQDVIKGIIKNTVPKSQNHEEIAQKYLENAECISILEQFRYFFPSPLMSEDSQKLNDFVALRVFVGYFLNNAKVPFEKRELLSNRIFQSSLPPSRLFSLLGTTDETNVRNLKFLLELDNIFPHLNRILVDNNPLSDAQIQDIFKNHFWNKIDSYGQSDLKYIMRNKNDKEFSLDSIYSILKKLNSTIRRRHTKNYFEDLVYSSLEDDTEKKAKEDLAGQYNFFSLLEEDFLWFLDGVSDFEIDEFMVRVATFSAPSDPLLVAIQFRENLFHSEVTPSFILNLSRNTQEFERHVHQIFTPLIIEYLKKDFPKQADELIDMIHRKLYVPSLQSLRNLFPNEKKDNIALMSTIIRYTLLDHLLSVEGVLATTIERQTMILNRVEQVSDLIKLATPNGEDATEHWKVFSMITKYHRTLDSLLSSLVITNHLKMKDIEAIFLPIINNLPNFTRKFLLKVLEEPNGTENVMELFERVHVLKTFNGNTRENTFSGRMGRILLHNPVTFEFLRGVALQNPSIKEHQSTFNETTKDLDLWGKHVLKICRLCVNFEECANGIFESDLSSVLHNNNDDGDGERWIRGFASLTFQPNSNNHINNNQKYTRCSIPLSMEEFPLLPRKIKEIVQRKTSLPNQAYPIDVVDVLESSYIPHIVSLSMKEKDLVRLDQILNERTQILPLVSYQLLKTLRGLRGANIVHGRLNFYTIFYDPLMGIFRVGGCGNALVENQKIPSLNYENLPQEYWQFLAPEIFLGSPPTSGSDLWSLAVIIFYLATGHFPYDLDTYNPIITARQLLEGEIVFPKLGNKLDDIIKQFTVIDPEKRLESHESVVSELFPRFKHEFYSSEESEDSLGEKADIGEINGMSKRQVNDDSDEDNDGDENDNDDYDDGDEDNDSDENDGNDYDDDNDENNNNNDYGNEDDEDDD